ncbi:NUDIX hydrolase [Leadbetterella sp. DM7]|uniref:NUDIX hydrolase n=1 Tax=Leadbetterella sp. DM7 TaxID=3235085 RepID=UPI00349E8D24
MIIFVSNIPVHILETPEAALYSQTINLEKDIVKFSEITGNPLIRNASHRSILNFMEFLQVNSSSTLAGVTFLVKNLRRFRKFLKKELQFVKAAGGVVENHTGKVLMMKRLGFWDLPKGKAEKGEKSEITAIREVEEECGVTVFADRRLVSTWHTYFQKGKLVIKRTRWYSMKLISDAKMAPQVEEGIEELAWMGPEELAEAVKQSYRSIIYVLDRYRERGVTEKSDPAG